MLLTHGIYDTKGTMKQCDYEGICGWKFETNCPIQLDSLFRPTNLGSQTKLKRRKRTSEPATNKTKTTQQPQNESKKTKRPEQPSTTSDFFEVLDEDMARRLKESNPEAGSEKTQRARISTLLLKAYVLL